MVYMEPSFLSSVLLTFCSRFSTLINTFPFQGRWILNLSTVVWNGMLFVMCVVTEAFPCLKEEAELEVEVLRQVGHYTHLCVPWACAPSVALIFSIILCFLQYGDQSVELRTGWQA